MVREIIKTVRGLFFFHALRLVARNMRVTRRRCLILAPHPDDETFGCAGLIALKCRLGAPVDVVFLTAGEAAHRGCCDTPAPTVAARRWDSACAALAQLGVPRERVHQLGLPDGNIPEKGAREFVETVEQLAALFSRVEPEDIYLPYPQEGWPDHVAASDIGSAASARYQAPHQLIFYPVWLWHTLRFRGISRLREWRPVRLDISVVQAEKVTAIRQYLTDINSACGVPYCGRLPRGFLWPFLKECEIFFLPRGERCP